MTKNNRFSLAFEKGHLDGLVDDGKYLRQSSLYKQILPRTRCRQIRSFLTYQVGPRNLRNLWLINDLRLCNGLHICRESPTDAERSLQIHPFLTNKANFLYDQINVSSFITMNYEQRTMNDEIKTNPIQSQNKPNSNPIQSQYKPNSNPIQSQYKPNTKPIQTQNKPNSNPNKANLKRYLAKMGLTS